MRRAGVVFLFAVIAAMRGFAQTEGRPRLEFDVVSIKPSAEGAFGVASSVGRSMTVRGTTLGTEVALAYGVATQLVSGGPDWVYSEKYDVAVKTEKQVSLADFREMRRRMLEDRFQVRAHYETKEMTIRALVVTKGGPKFRETENPVPSTERETIRTLGYRRLRAKQTLMVQLATVLERDYLRSTVVDKTGLTGVYDFLLEWEADPRPEDAATAGVSPEPEFVMPSLFAALEKQLGLKLVRQKAPVRVVVIDHAERPTPN